MKKLLLLKSLLLLCALIVGTSSSWAEDPSWSHEFVSPEAISNNSITVNGATWNVSTTVGKGSPTIDKGNSYSKYCLKFGSGANNYYSNVTFTTNYFKNYNVKSVTVQVLHNASKSGTLTVTQGSTTIGTTSQTVGTSWTDMTVNTTTGSGGNLSISYSPTTCAVNIHSITVVYTTGGSSDPSIDVTPTSQTIYYDTEDGTLAVSTNKINTTVGTNIQYFESDGTTPAVSNPYASWFEAEINGEGNVEYILEENADPDNDRTAYFKVHGKNEANTEDVYSDLISITQSKYSVDYATLPFAFNGGKDDAESTVGLTQNGLGSDYSSDTNPDTKLKFDHQGDYLILKVKGALFDELDFDIKGNSLSGSYAFKVQWSANGTDYTDLATYTTIGAEDTKTIDISSCTGLKYIKWIYTTKASGNVGLGNIKVTPQTESVTIGANKYSTYCSTNALTFANTDVKAYKAKVEGGKVVLTQVDVVPANTGVILYYETAGDYDIPLASGTPAAVTENELIGVNTSTLVEWTTGGDGKYNYILQGGVFKKAATGGHLKANRAYLHTSYDVTTAGAREYLEFAFEDDNETTGLSEELRMKNEEFATATWYTLDGRKLDGKPATKGLYIVNGKKVVIK